MNTKFYYLLIMVGAMAIGKFVCSNMNHRHRPSTLPSVSATYVDPWHMDSAEKYLIRYTGDTAVIKPYKSKRDE